MHDTVALQIPLQILQLCRAGWGLWRQGLRGGLGVLTFLGIVFPYILHAAIKASVLIVFHFVIQQRSFTPHFCLVAWL
jgi:hypothetical protein